MRKKKKRHVAAKTIFAKRTVLAAVVEIAFLFDLSLSLRSRASTGRAVLQMIYFLAPDACRSPRYHFPGDTVNGNDGRKRTLEMSDEALDAAVAFCRPFRFVLRAFLVYNRCGHVGHRVCTLL